MKNINYITIAGWMVNEEKLNGNELLCYALIYGFSQDGNWCECTHQYIADWLSVSKRTVISLIQSLVEKGKLQKEIEEKQGVKFCKYRALTSPEVKNFHGGGEESSHNDNKEDKIKEIDANASLSDSKSDDEVINYDGLIKYWNEQTKGIWGKLNSIENNRKKMVRARIREHGKKSFMQAILMACQSSYLRSQTWFNFDWMIKPNNFDKLISGNYNHEEQAQQQLESNKTRLGYKESIDEQGNRYYLQGYGKHKVIVPMDAPPRPAFDNCYWSQSQNKWYQE